MSAESAAITEGDGYDGYRGADYTSAGWLRHTKALHTLLRFFKSPHKVFDVLRLEA